MVNTKIAFDRRRARDSYKYGHSDKPVLGVFRSNKHINVYLSKDKKVLCSVGTNCKTLPEALKNKNNLHSSEWVALELASKLKSLNISEVVFNKSGYKFHGRVAHIVKIIRENGIKC